MKKAQKENLVFRYAMLSIIADCVRKNGRRIYLDGYERESDRVSFTNEGHYCTLYGVDAPKEDDGLLPLTVRTNLQKKKELWLVTLSIASFRCSTLERIAYEVYDYTKRENDEDWEVYCKEVVANWYDSKL